MALEIVQGTEIQTQATGVKIDPRAFRESAMSGSKILSALGSDVSGVFQQVADSMTKVSTTKHVFDFTNMLDKAKSDFDGKLITIQDGKQFKPEFDKYAKDQIDGYFKANPDLSPFDKNLLSQKGNAWKNSLSSEYNTRGLIKFSNDTIKSGLESSVKLANTYSDNRDLGIKIASAPLYELRNQNLISDQQLREHLDKVPEIVDQSRFEHALRINANQAQIDINDPAVDKNGNYLKFPAIKGNVRDSAVSQAQARANSQTKKANVEVTDKIDQWLRDPQGPAPFTADDLKSKYVDTHIMTQSAANGYMDLINGNTTPEQITERTQKFYNQIKKLKRGMTDAQFSAAEINLDQNGEFNSLSAPVKADLKKYLTSRKSSPVLKETWKNDILSEIRSTANTGTSIVPDFITQEDAKTGSNLEGLKTLKINKYNVQPGGIDAIRDIKKISDDDYKLKYPNIPRDKLVRLMEESRDDMVETAREFMLDNPEAKPKEIRDYVHSLEAEKIYDAVNNILVPKVQYLKNQENPKKEKGKDVQGAVEFEEGALYKFSNGVQKRRVNGVWVNP